MPEWFPWYPSLYKADTMHLSVEQDGIYRRLLDHYMETRQQLPDNDFALARIAGIDIDLWHKNSSIIKAFFNAKKEGYLSHKRCDVELDRQDGKTSSHSERGKKGAKRRWENNNKKQYAVSKSIEQAMLNDGRGEEIRGEEKERKKESRSTSALFPDDVIPLGKDYAWQGELISLTQAHYSAFKKLAPNIDLDEFLTDRDKYLAGLPETARNKKNWFMSTRAELAKAQEFKESKISMGL